MNIKIVYDDECPFCKDFIQMTNLRQEGHDVSLINARESKEELVLKLSESFNLDDGMVAIVDGKIYFGAAAAHMIVILSTTKGMKSQIYRLILKNERIANYAYPVLAKLRKLFFVLARKDLINDK